MNIKELLLKSILAGICIGIGGAFFLAIDNKIVGSLIFTLGLFTIVTRGLHLFTGRLGYILDNDLNYALSLIITWLGNLIGTSLVGYSLRLTRFIQFEDKALSMCAIKLNDTYLSLFILAILCNILMYIAVDGFKTNNHELGKYLGLFLCVGGFILAGFEHCVANMFYFSFGNVWSIQALIAMLVMTAGNIVGGQIIPIITKLSK